MPYKDKSKQAQYQNKWMQDRRLAYLQGKCCAHCGSTETLQVDHIDRSTKVSHRIWSWSAIRRDAELAKCQVLCTPCHQAKSINEQLVEIVHGTRDGYAHHGCRCAECKQASSRYLKERKYGSFV